MEPSTSKRKMSREHKKTKRNKTTKLILEALSEDGSIDMELLKLISLGCLEELKKRHDEGKCQKF